MRRAWPPLACGCLSCGRHSAQSFLAAFRVAGAVHRASWTNHYTTSHISLITPRVWQAQYTEPPGQRLPHSSLHHFSHLTHHTTRVAGAVHRASWPTAAFRVAGAIHRELPGQAAARVAAAGPRLPAVSLITHHPSLHHLITSHSSHHSCGRRSTQSLLERSCVVWQVQYTEPPGGGAARVVAAGPRLPFVWQAQHAEPPGGGLAGVSAGAAHRASWRSSGLVLTPSFTHNFVTHHL